MYVKAITGKGFFEIYENVSNVNMSLNKCWWPSPEEPTKEGELVNVESLEKAASYIYKKMFKHDGGIKNVALRYIKNEDQPKSEDFGRSCRAIFFFSKDGQQQNMILSEHRLFLCSDEGKTMEKW